jgi:hypothetical protein
MSRSDAEFLADRSFELRDGSVSVRKDSAGIASLRPPS